MKITFLGHASLEIKIDEFSIVVDPFISGNPFASDVDIDSLKPDFILITHAHQDHILDVEKLAKENDSIIISNFEIVNYFQNKGLKGHPMNHGGKWNFDFGELKYVNAIHTSTFPDGENGGQPGGFIISANNKSIYIAGDTALTYDMKLIPLKYNLDLAVLPIGDNFTMGYEDAILASDFIQCDKILGYHYDTFGLIEINETNAIDKFKERGKNLILLKPLESLEV
ncbi:MAG: metal-dependent hydrolase [Cryomorphaceae bacterium]|jgi:L-ascorbate metabolism protein UlaG (beta-lactamase superfamily)|nr:metal-dependent hydrolase [Cryomorphaceae bacterium]MBT3503214.1 metal-dependent hydrolase [Cryomorphaceae bacterium]MBT3688584.1 metal-dependent hydrolase [Cryomorphaceae bacterium]MBT4293863.1 metal-dependent hydrolase [Cryomorphaceae bacterium]MBT5936035.1 metal-dependent hydrolase [Cryomorphaceae bacterium]